MGIKISSKAPTRIDLAGGTIDLWPLYLFLDRPTTINLGIDLFAEATLEYDPDSRGPGGVKLRSEDQDVELRVAWGNIAEATAPPQLDLHLKLLRIFTGSAGSKRAQGDLALSTRARSPAGAGLGGSSTLSIAMIGALASWDRGNAINPIEEGTKWIDVVRDVETTVIQVPAGVQDYYGAMYGGLQSLQWGAGSHHREWLPAELPSELEKRILLFYSGQSRNSGINNWALFKGFIDKQSDIRGQFKRINEAAKRLESALRKRDWEAAGAAIADEWNVRRALASGISTPEIDMAFETAREVAPGRSGKVCGAGGGGCFFIYLPDPKDKAAVERALVGRGMRTLPFRAVSRGLDVQVSRA